ncbi:hypothetical protein BGZ83_004694, partial [Gryganskiella cystojenkinii]
ELMIFATRMTAEHIPAPVFVAFRYMSPAQREAICLREDGSSITQVDLPQASNISTTSLACVTKSINVMLQNNQFPNKNANEDDLYGYLQFVSPFLSEGSTNVSSTAQFCSSCNQQVANIFSNYYEKNPSPYSLNFAQQLKSDRLNGDLKFQYKKSCSIDLGVKDKDAFKPTNVTNDPTGPPKNKDSGAAASDPLWGLGLVIAAVASALMTV